MSRDFAGADYINCGDFAESTFDGSNDLLTVGMWVNHDSNSGNQIWISKYETTGDPDERTLLIFFRNTDEWQSTYYDDGNGSNQRDAITSDSPITQNTWHYVTITFDLGEATTTDIIKNYADGVRRADSDTPTGTPPTVFKNNTTAILIGAWKPAAPGLYMLGLISHQSIHNIEMSSTMIGALARGIHPFVMRTDNLIKLWELIGLDSPEGQMIGQNNPGVLTNTTKGATNPPVELIENYL